MNIDLLPFSAFALEACASASSARGDGHTLTLELALSTSPAPHDAMSGSATANLMPAPSAMPLRAAVLTVDPSPLILTF